MLRAEENVFESGGVVAKDVGKRIRGAPPHVGRRDTSGDAESIEPQLALSPVELAVWIESKSLRTIDVRRELAVGKCETSGLAVLHQRKRLVFRAKCDWREDSGEVSPTRGDSALERAGQSAALPHRAV